MEEHRPKKLLDRVGARPACGEGMLSASHTIPYRTEQAAEARSYVVLRLADYAL